MPNIADLKVAAKAVRAICAEHGVPLTQSQALEALAKQHGFRDWNSASAALPADEDEAALDHRSPLDSRRMYELLMGRPAIG